MGWETGVKIGFGVLAECVGSRVEQVTSRYVVPAYKTERLQS
jgi:hypothetical protein